MIPGLNSLRSRLMVAFTLMTALTVLLIGVPAVLLIDRELARQVEARLSQGASASRALFNAEVREMRDLVTLTSERPTLRRLIVDDDRTELRPYLATIQRSAALSIVSVADASGEVIAVLPVEEAVPWAREPVTQPTARYTARRDSQGKWTVALEARAPVLADDGTPIGIIYQARELDDAALNELRNETGLFHNLVLDDSVILATVLNEAMFDAPDSLPFYVRRMPLLETPEGTIDDVLALPKLEVNQARNRLLLLLAGVTAVVASGAGLTGLLLSHRVTAPLKRLVNASAALGRGDLTTPIAVQGDVSEVQSLSQTLEQMRKRVRNAYQEVDESNRWHENLLASLTEGVFTVNDAGLLTSFSAGASRILGWKGEEVLGRHYSVVFSSSSTVQNQPAPLLTAPGTVTRQTVRTRSGDSITLRTTSGERTETPGNHWEQAYVFRDVTEEEHAARVREFLLANVSHEFKTPLAALHAAVELLATEGPELSPREAEQLIEAIRHGTLRLDELVENLIASAGLQTGHFPVHLQPTDLDTVIEEVLLTSRPLLALRGQFLKVDTPSPLRPVRGDARRLQQVLNNLISNASKYGPRDALITLAVEERDTESVIAVSDSGGGVPEELRPYLFRPFARQGTPDRGGIGLGLSIVKAIVERHGGRVGMDSSPSGGATFWFTLPFAETNDPRA